MGPNSETSQRGPTNVYKDKRETSQSERYFLRRRNTNTHPKPQKTKRNFRGGARPNVLDTKQEATIKENLRA
jgi:hypothetical protein